MYETLSPDYDRFVNWHSRLSLELPFITNNLDASSARYVLDAATGTGMHAIALVKSGYQTVGADLSHGMIERARLNAHEAGVQVRFENAGFGDLAQTFGAASFDAVLCLGNSLPHLLSRRDLDKTLVDFDTCLKPGGILIIQNRNFDAVIANHERWMEPQSHRENGSEWIFQRFYDFNPDGLLTFNLVILKRSQQDNWSQQVTTSLMRPILKVELSLCLFEAGFTSLATYGNMTGDPFNPDKSSNLVIVARKHA